ncbi:MFS transporter [Arthrobacter sp. MYb224]|uniref:MFS transporter n=1 Tax=Arthrobacter sp. MYb224 TaxID=1848600 RepID=UPI000CFC5D43|nr:MFS transporter [Arthrobacter sp. MYb224]PQZ96863.1 MFS transporter [Arthrobacter sp. MYb224]
MSVISELRMQPARTRPLTWNPGTTTRLSITVLVSFTLLVGANLATPLYPQLQAELSLGAMGTTIAFASYVCSLMFFLSIVGHWSDHIGRRAALVLAIIVSLVGTLSFGAASTLWELCLGRGLQGAGVALATGASAAALRELLPHKPEWASRFTLLASSGGVAFGPLLGGVLALLPGGRTTVFTVQAVLLLATLIPLVALQARPAIAMAERGQRHRALAPRRLGIPREARAKFWMGALVGFLSFAVFGFALSLAPGYFAQVFELTSLPVIGLVAGLPLGISALSQVVIRGGQRLLPLGLVVLAASTIGLVVAAELGSLWLAMLALALIGLGQGIAFRTAFSGAVNAVSASLHAQTVSTIYLVTYLGSALPVIALGWAVGVYGQELSILVFGVLCALLALLLTGWSVASLAKDRTARA